MVPGHASRGRESGGERGGERERARPPCAAGGSGRRNGNDGVRFPICVTREAAGAYAERSRGERGEAPLPLSRVHGNMRRSGCRGGRNESHLCRLIETLLDLPWATRHHGLKVVADSDADAGSDIGLVGRLSWPAATPA